MKVIIAIFLTAVLVFPAFAQNAWVVLEEYPSPGGSAQGLYYANKYLWHVNGDEQGVSSDCYIYKLNPYNMTVIDSIISPIPVPWGITFANERFWLSGFDWDSSRLAKLQPDTFLVDTVFYFPNWYFYGVTCDSINKHLYVCAMSHTDDNLALLEFDATGDSVYEWHTWGGQWNLGIQYWDSTLYVNTSNWNYPDYTYLYDIETGTMLDTYLCPDPVPEGIATNGFVWWISYLRYGNHFIYKVLPPGASYHDMAAYASVNPQSGTIPTNPLIPEFDFINYGSVAETDVLFACRITETATNLQIYYNDVYYTELIEPEDIIRITYLMTPYFEEDTDYTFTFWCHSEVDQVHANDTMRVYVHTNELEYHDLAILSVIEPEASEPDSNVSSIIVVQNQGDFFESSAPVELDILHPDGAISNFAAIVSNLDINEIDTMYFPEFIAPEPGEYQFTFDGQLPLDIDPMNDLAIQNCSIGYIHDVTTQSIVAPDSVLPFGPSIEPEAIFANIGDYDENAFYVNCWIQDSTTSLVYDEHMVCAPLSIGEQISLSFTDFEAPYPGEFKFTYFTSLGIDNNRSNDTLSIDVNIGNIHDVAPIEIIWPVETTVTEPFPPTVVVKNLGDMSSSGFFVSCLIDSGTTMYYLLQEWCDSLEPDNVDTLEFSLVNLTDPGYYRFLFRTNWSEDDIPANDSLGIWSELLVPVVDIDELNVSEFKVEGNYPNPFNASTAFTVALPHQADVSISLFNLRGQEISSWNYGLQNSGIHRFTISATELPSGLYLARISADDESDFRRIVLLK